MKAIKGNKEYTIGDEQKKFYQDSGFDIVDDSGNVIAYGRGKTVPYEIHAAILKENERLHGVIKDLEVKLPKEPAEDQEAKPAGRKKGE